MQFTNLWEGYNENEHFRILICAESIEEAIKLAEEYRKDSKMEGTFEVKEDPYISNKKFDCDYVIY